MHACKTMANSAAVFILITSSALAAGTAAASPGSNDGGTRVVLDATLRNCDFSAPHDPPAERGVALANGIVVVRHSGARAAAEVQFADAPDPGSHFTVGLIQEPRPSSASCGPGAPGTAFTGLDTDAAGNGTVTVQDTIRPGTTGVWVIVERADPHGQDPLECYTSEFMAPV